MPWVGVRRGRSTPFVAPKWPLVDDLDVRRGLKIHAPPRQSGEHKLLNRTERERERERLSRTASASVLARHRRRHSRPLARVHHRRQPPPDDFTGHSGRTDRQRRYCAAIPCAGPVWTTLRTLAGPSWPTHHPPRTTVTHPNCRTPGSRDVHRPTRHDLTPPTQPTAAHRHFWTSWVLTGRWAGRSTAHRGIACLRWTSVNWAKVGRSPSSEFRGVVPYRRRR
jgi:hypothetical protein